ncbi:MAG: hypothetical protein WAK17_12400 [Candidatus Nitrosopolaris sp.]|jgi:hypothetical protein
MRDSKRSSYPDKRSPYLDYVYYKEIKQNWLKEPPERIFPISIHETRMVYSMTLGSLYYDMEIKKVKAKESETEIGRQTTIFLETKYPELWRKWAIIKNDTNSHLDHIANDNDATSCYNLGHDAGYASAKKRLPHLGF